MIGDTDSGGEITVMNATSIRCRLSKLKYNGTKESMQQNTDIDGNACVDIVDASYLQRHLVEIEFSHLIG